MPTNTSKFNLVKPLKSEKYNVDVFNGNADIIDSQIYSKTEVDTALNGKANSVHTHPISEVVNLQTALNGKANSVHGHVKSDITDFAHTHPINEVTNLQTALDGKANTTTTVNNKALSSNITINASDVPNTPAGNISATNVQNAINELDTEKANRTQEAWITPTLLNGYTSVAGQTVRYRKTEFGEVVMQGRATGGTQGAPILILPVGYRPTIPTYIPSASGTNFALLWVEANGNVSVLGAGNTNIALYSVRFFID